MATRPTVLAVVVALVVAASGGAAYGTFGSSNRQSASGSIGRSASVTVSAANGAADLLPGETGAAYVTIANPNPFDVTFSTVTNATVASDDPAACPSHYVSIAPGLPHRVAPPIVVAARSTSGTLPIAGLVRLSTAAPSSCQGISFTVSVTLAGTST